MKQRRNAGGGTGLLSPDEREFIAGTAKTGSKRKFRPQRKYDMRRNIQRKFTLFLDDLVLLARQKSILRSCLLQTYNQRTDLVNALNYLSFDHDPGLIYSYKFRSGRNAKHEIIYWLELLDRAGREYRNGVLSGEIWDQQFPFMGLRPSAGRLLRRAQELGVDLPKSREAAVTRKELVKAVEWRVGQQSRPRSSQ